MKDEKEFKISPAAISAMMNGDYKNAMIAATPCGIEKQEAEGQKDFVTKETLPSECPRNDLEKLGFVFGEQADDIFTYAQFPEGWKKIVTDHSMWSDLIDAMGRKRGSIFYKAAFYDKSAHMVLNCKIKYSQVYEQHDNYILDHVQYFVTDGENILFETKPVEAVKYSDKYYEVDEAASTEVQNWLDANYPNYNDPMAYWD